MGDDLAVYHLKAGKDKRVQKKGEWRGLEEVSEGTPGGIETPIAGPFSTQASAPSVFYFTSTWGGAIEQLTTLGHPNHSGNPFHFQELTVDHIDSTRVYNSKNNHIDNLQTLTATQNTAKG